MHKKKIIELKDVSFQYSGTSGQLHHLSLDIFQGECILITGASGCGKSTLTRLINGLIPYHYEGKLSGSVSIHEEATDTLPSWEFGKIAGSVFQDSRTQFFTSHVKDELAFAPENYGRDPEWIKHRMDELFARLKIEALKARKLNLLSSGEKQKVAMASAQMNDPEIYILDEPTANLDMRSAYELAEMIRQLKAMNKTVIVADHRLYYLMGIADRVIYMREGQIAHQWTGQEMLDLSTEELRHFGLRLSNVQYQRQKEGFNASSDIALELNQVTVTAGNDSRRLLSDLNLTVRKGEVVAIAGSNGIGKTTLAKIICGLKDQGSGRIRILQKEMKAKQRLKHCWFVLQESDYQLFSESVRHELILDRSEDDIKKAEDILKKLDLWDLKDRHPASLSGGQKQRLALAVGMMRNPDILILDEPTSGLDEANMNRVIEIISEQAARGCSVIIISHDYEFISRVSNRFIYLSDKTIQQDFLMNRDSFQSMVACLNSPLP